MRIMNFMFKIQKKLLAARLIMAGMLKGIPAMFCSCFLIQLHFHSYAERRKHTEPEVVCLAGFGKKDL